MARITHVANPTIASRRLNVGTNTIWDGLNAGSYEDFVAISVGGQYEGGIVKKVPQTTMKGTRYDSQEDNDSSVAFVTTDGNDGDIVMFSNVYNGTSYDLQEIGTGSFAAGSIVYGVVDSTTKKVKITSTKSGSTIVVGVVHQAPVTEGQETNNKFVLVKLRMVGQRFAVPSST